MVRAPRHPSLSFLLPFAGEGSPRVSEGRMRDPQDGGDVAHLARPLIRPDVVGPPSPASGRREGAPFLGCVNILHRLRRGRLFLALFCLCAAAPACADATGPAVDPSIGKVEVTLDLPKDKPYVGEMVMLRMRSFIRAYIVLDDIRQPPMVDFDVQQLGRDKPVEAMIDGFQVEGIERDLAIFPQQAGRLIIEPFVRHVTIVNSDGSRSQADFASKPVYIDVQTYQAVNPAGTWWLPVKSLSMTDT